MSKKREFKKREAQKFTYVKGKKVKIEDDKKELKSDKKAKADSQLKNENESKKKN